MYASIVVARIRECLLGRRCWYAAHGGAAGSHVSLSLGEKLPRKGVLKNVALSEEYRQYAGEQELYLFCPWRITAEGSLAVLSEDDEQVRSPAIEALVGAIVTQVEVDPATWSAALGFSTQTTLEILCDVAADLEDWHFLSCGDAYYFGPNGDLERNVRQHVVLP